MLVALLLAGALNLYHLPNGVLWQLSVLRNELEPIRVDRLSRLFGYLFEIGALVGIVFALHLRDRFELAGAWSTWAPPSVRCSQAISSRSSCFGS